MKSCLIIFTFLVFVFSVNAQENMITLSGGYSFANIEDTDVKATGWRINALYEFNPKQGVLSNGISVAYINTDASESTLLEDITYNFNSWPIYYAPKAIFGGEKLKFFVKGAIGIHISKYERTGTILIVEDKVTGFYGGLSAGVLFFFSEKIFINLEYEWAYMSNSYYVDSFMNSPMLGLGIRF